MELLDLLRKIAVANLTSSLQASICKSVGEQARDNQTAANSLTGFTITIYSRRCADGTLIMTGLCINCLNVVEAHCYVVQYRRIDREQ